MRKSAWITLAIGVVFAGFVFYSLARVEPIEVVHSQLRRSGDTVYVVGRVQNTGDVTRSVDLEIHYYDQSGRPLGQDLIGIDHLKPYQTRDFRSPARQLTNASDFSIYLNHGRNPYGN